MLRPNLLLHVPRSQQEQLLPSRIPSIFVHPYSTNLRSVDKCTRRFKCFLDAYFHKTGDKKVLKFNIADGHTWEEVKAEMDKAVESYNTKERFWRKTPNRVAGRTTGSRIPAIKAWLDILPDGEYTSIVCGALKLIFGVRLDFIILYQQLWLRAT